MKELSVGEIVGYAIKIEKESLKYYEGASERMKDAEVKALLLDLAGQEREHIGYLEGLIEEGWRGADYLENRVNIDRSNLERIVKTDEIGGEATPRAVLETARDREVSTRET